MLRLEILVHGRPYHARGSSTDNGHLLPCPNFCHCRDVLQNYYFFSSEIRRERVEGGLEYKEKHPWPESRMRHDRSDGDVVMSGTDIPRDGPIIGYISHGRQCKLKFEGKRRKRREKNKVDGS